MTYNVAKKMPPIGFINSLTPTFPIWKLQNHFDSSLPSHPYPITTCAHSSFLVLLITTAADPMTDSQWPGHVHCFLNSPWKDSHLSGCFCFCFCCSSLALSRLGKKNKNLTYSSKSFTNVSFSANIPDHTQNWSQIKYIYINSQG